MGGSLAAPVVVENDSGRWGVVVSSWRGCNESLEGSAEVVLTPQPLA